MTTIWIIEDNPEFRSATVRGLSANSPEHQTFEFESCEESIEALDAGSFPEIVLMDIGLPGMDGIDGIGEIKQRSPNTSILILTVFEDDEKIFRALKAGASGYLLKSDSIESISDSIRHVIDGAAPIHPRIAGRVLKMFAQLAPAKKDYGLTAREQKVLECMAQGLVRKQIVKKLDLKLHTVDYIARRIYRKLHVSGATAAVAMAAREQLLESPPDDDLRPN